MDVFSTVGTTLAVATLLIKVVEIGRCYVKEIQNWNEDVYKLGLCMSVAMNRTETIRNVYFGTPALSPSQVLQERASGAPYPIFDHLRAESQINVVAMMQQYHDVVLLKHRTLHAAYDLETSQKEPKSTSQKNKKFQLSWVFGGKKKVQEMIDECEGWNDKLFEIIQIYILEKSFLLLATESSFSRPFRFEQLKSNDDIKTLGLNGEIDLIRISEEGDNGWKQLELITGIVFDDESRGQLKFGTHDNRRVLGDFKVFQPLGQDYSNLGAAEPPKAVLDRIHQLAVLLNRQHSIRSRLLRCRGFYRDATSLAYVFILDFPRGRSHNPISLQDLLSSSPYRSKKPALERRLKLALTLAIALFQFHAVGWVHKSFRNTNILFFPTEPDTILPEDLNEPWLVGFEYAREDPGFSESPSEAVDVSNDIYRHPNRWGQPTCRFEKLHDVYSLGLTLLEIGMWQAATKLDYYGFKSIKYSERFDVQALFVQQARDKLPFMVGSTYANVVIKCLTGEFEVEDRDSAESPEELYREQILSTLRRLSERL